MPRRSVRLGDVIEIKHGCAFPGEFFGDNPTYPTLVTPGNFAIGGGFKESKTKTFVGSYPGEYMLSPGDLIISMTDLSREGATLGLPAMVPDDRTYLHNQRIGLVQVRDSAAVCTRFLNYYLRTSEYRSYVLSTASGTTVRHTSPSRVCAFVAELPDLPEQWAIATVLGALDDKMAANATLIQVATELARTIYSARTTGHPVVVVADVLTPVLGGTPPRESAELWGGGILWASAKDVAAAPGGVVLATSETIAELAATKRIKILPVGTVVLTARGTVGAVARLGAPAAINQSCYGFTPRDIPPSCLYFVVESVADQALSLTHGSVFDTITMRTFVYVHMPSLAATDWAALEELISPLLGRAKHAVSESEALRRTRDELLPLLMSGRIRVRDAEKVVEEVT